MFEPPAISSASPIARAVPPAAGIASFCERHYRVLAVLTLLLAALNLGFRLDREVVTTWDESLYATTAAEMVKSGNWLVTTFDGEVDYYNTKPPLNVWLIAGSFELFGISLWSLRLPSFIAAFLTVAILQWWVRRCINAVTAVITTVVLATTFSFIYVHSARSGNPDAWLALFILLTVITLWSARTHRWRLAWLGPLAAGVFLLKGMAVLLPLTLILAALVALRMLGRALLPLCVAGVLFAVPTGLWALARWRFDRWRFFDGLFNYDFVALVSRPLEGHEHSWLYYLHVVQKDHYDWLVTAAMLLLVLVLSRREAIRVPIPRDLRLLLAIWGGATLLVPTAIATKTPWYVNSFYPLFALGIAIVIAAAFAAFPAATHRRERTIVAVMVLLAFGVAEGKLAWYSYKQRDLDGSMQAFFLESPEKVANRRVLLEEWDPADRFVLTHLANGLPVTGNPEQIAAGADERDLLILTPADGGWTLTNARSRSSDSPDPEHEPAALPRGGGGT